MQNFPIENQINQSAKTRIEAYLDEEKKRIQKAERKRKSEKPNSFENGGAAVAAEKWRDCAVEGKKRMRVRA